VINDVRKGEADRDAPLFTDNAGNALTGNAVRKLFDRLKVVTGIDDLCGHAPPHLGDELPPLGERSRFDLQAEGGWRTGADGRAIHEVAALRRASTRTVAAHRIPRSGLKGKRPSQQGSGLSAMRTA